MFALLSAELIRLRATRSLGVLAVIGVALAALATLGTAVAGGADATADDILSAVGLAEPFALILGVLLLGGEFRHRSIGGRLLVTPRREHLIAAKMITSFGTGLAFGLLTVAGSLAVAVSARAAQGHPLPLGDADVWATSLGFLLAITAATALGTAVAAVVRSRTGAITGALVWLLGVEIAVAAAAEIGKSTLLKAVVPYLPGAALDALADLGAAAPTKTLSAWAGGLIILSWIAAFAVGGTALLKTRDL